MPLNNDAEHILKIKTTLYRYFRCCIRYYVQNDKTETSFNAPMYLMFSDIMILHVYAIAVFLKLLAASNALVVYILFWSFETSDNILRNQK